MVLGIYGAGGLGRTVKEIADVLENWNELIFIDDTVPANIFKGTRRMPYQQFKNEYTTEKAEVVIALGEPQYKRMIYDKVSSDGYKFANIIHPTAIISPSSTLGRGIIANIGATVSADSIIEDNVTLQQYTVIAHDSIVHRHSQISAFAMVAGNCEIGEETYIGLHAAIKESVRVGDHSLVGMCSAVAKDIDSYMTVSGNPARIVAKRLSDEKVFHGGKITNIEKYNHAFCEALEISEVQVKTVYYEQTETWDSVGHMHLIAALEEIFHIVISEEDIISITSYNEGKKVLQSKYGIVFEN